MGNKNTIQIKELVLGEGMPKICVPMIGRDYDQLMEEADFLMSADADMVEWRVDFFKDIHNMEKIKAALQSIRSVLSEVPLIFTFRSAKEGGEQELSSADYFQLNREIAATGQIDVMDIELFNKEEDIRELVEFAHRHKVKVIISNHDFEKTPNKEELISRLCKAQDLKADLPKIAVMPKSPGDVLTLLDATYTMNETYATRPIITMSMAGQGVVSRLAGEIFGSAMTFGSAKNTSAPGQVNVDELRKVLSLFHKNL